MTRNHQETQRGLAHQKRATTPACPPLRDLVARDERAGGALGQVRRSVMAGAERRLSDLEALQRVLEERAAVIVEDARRDLALHEVPFTCVRQRGSDYHLYERDGRRWFSILEPGEYARADARARFLGTFRLHYDETFERLA